MKIPALKVVLILRLLLKAQEKIISTLFTAMVIQYQDMKKNSMIKAFMEQILI